MVSWKIKISQFDTVPTASATEAYLLAIENAPRNNYTLSIRNIIENIFIWDIYVILQGFAAYNSEGRCFHNENLKFTYIILHHDLRKI